MRRFLVAFVVGCALGAPAAHAVTPAEGEVLTTMVATAASNDPRIDVVTMADLQKVVALAAERELFDCKAAEACLGEVAAAMDAAAVLHGKIGTLGEQVVLNLSLFDTTTSTAVGRATASGRDTGALAAGIDAAVVRLLEKLPASTTGRKVRVLVMDLDLAGARDATTGAQTPSPSPSPSPPATPSRWNNNQAWVGVGVGALGGVAALGGVFAYLQAQSLDNAADGADTAATAAATYDQRDAWTAVMVAAGGCGLVGGVVGGALIASANPE
jgi:hypothetical protein